MQTHFGRHSSLLTAPCRPFTQQQLQHLHKGVIDGQLFPPLTLLVAGKLLQCIGAWKAVMPARLPVQQLAVVAEVRRPSCTPVVKLKSVTLLDCWIPSIASKHASRLPPPRSGRSAHPSWSRTPPRHTRIQSSAPCAGQSGRPSAPAGKRRHSTGA